MLNAPFGHAEPDRLRLRGVARGLAVLFVLVAVPGLAACASGPARLPVEVTRFTSLPAAPAEQTPAAPASGAAEAKPAAAVPAQHAPSRRFRVVPLDDRAPASLEFDAYAGHLIRQLELQGHRLAAPGQPAEWTAYLGWSVDGGTQSLDAAPQFDWVNSFVLGPRGEVYAVPRFAYVGSQLISRIRFQREVQVAIREGDANPAGKPVFEATARSAGANASIAPVMPAMLQAIFAGFPGNNGETAIIDVPLGKGETGGKTRAPTADDSNQERQ